MTTPIYQTVILGGGFTGLFTALHLSHQHYPRSVILIDQNERFCFKPLLYEYFSGEMDAGQVVPRYAELLQHSGVIFVQGSVASIQLSERRIKLVDGTAYDYSNLVLALGSVTGYFGVEGAPENALPFRTQADAIAIDRRLRDCLLQAVQTQDATLRQHLLTTVVIGGGPSGVEMAATLADFLPQWYTELGGEAAEVRVVLMSHGELLEGDVNHSLRETAQQALQERTVPVEVMIGAKVTAVHPNSLEYELNAQTATRNAGTIIWTSGTKTHPLIESLSVSADQRDKHGRLKVNERMQLSDFPDVFAGGDCAVALQSESHVSDREPSSSSPAVQENGNEIQHTQTRPLPPTAQVAYQQGAAIAHNLRALALGYVPKPAQVNLRGTLLKLGLENSAANIFNAVTVTGEAGHLIRQGTYLELLPTPIHNFKATSEWIKDTVIEQYQPDNLKKIAKTVGVVGGVLLGAAIARRVARSLADD